LKSDVDSVSGNISRLKKQLSFLQQEKNEEVFFLKMQVFVSESEQRVSRIQRSIKKDLEETRIQLAHFLCEDEKDFKLEETFRIFHTFCQAFKGALEENRRRRETEQRLEARKMMQLHHQQQIREQNSFSSSRPHSLELSGSSQVEDRNLDESAALMLFEFLRSSSSEGPGNEGNLFGASLRRSLGASVRRRSRGWTRESCQDSNGMDGRERHQSQETIISVKPHASLDSSYSVDGETSQGNLIRNEPLRKSIRRFRPRRTTRLF